MHRVQAMGLMELAILFWKQTTDQELLKRYSWILIDIFDHIQTISYFDNIKALDHGSQFNNLCVDLKLDELSIVLPSKHSYELVRKFMNEWR